MLLWVFTCPLVGPVIQRCQFQDDALLKNKIIVFASTIDEEIDTIYKNQIR